MLRRLKEIPLYSLNNRFISILNYSLLNKPADL